MKILAVDDDPLLLELLEATLCGAGYENVTLANSPLDALRILEESLVPFKCILLDIQMPEMDGIELCSRIRKLEHYQTTPILMITAMTERSFVERAFAAGANDYISKPFDPFELATRLRLAEESIQQQRIVAEKVFALQHLKREVERKSRFNPETAIPIEDVPGVVDQVELENHLLQMSRSEQYQTVAVAFQIEEFDAIYARSQPSELFLTLTDVAECIADQLKRTSFIMAYAGLGVFVCLLEKNAPVLSPELLQFAQYAVDELQLEYEDGTPCKVTLAMGEVQHKTLFFSGAPTAIVHEAIESARSVASQSRFPQRHPSRIAKAV